MSWKVVKNWERSAAQGALRGQIADWQTYMIHMIKTGNYYSTRHQVFQTNELSTEMARSWWFKKIEKRKTRLTRLSGQDVLYWLSWGDKPWDPSPGCCPTKGKTLVSKTAFSFSETKYTSKPSMSTFSAPLIHNMDGKALIRKVSQWERYGFKAEEDSGDHVSIFLSQLQLSLLPPESLKYFLCPLLVLSPLSLLSLGPLLPSPWIHIIMYKRRTLLFALKTWDSVPTRGGGSTNPKFLSNYSNTKGLGSYC